MSVQVEDLSTVEKKLSFVVDASTVSNKLDEAYRTLGKQVQMKGFRPGKVPRRILEKRFGRHIEGEVAQGVIAEAFDEAIEEQGFVPVSQPIVEQGRMAKDEDYSFSVTVEIKPSLTIEGWAGLEVEWEGIDVSDEQVMDEVKQMAQRSATVEAADEGYEAAEGDMVLIDGSFTVEGNDTPRELKGLMVLAGQETGMASMDWLAPKVVGMKVGDNKAETLTAPEESLGEGFDGNEGELNITISEIKVTKLPELDDDFAQDVGFDSMDLLKGDIRFKLEEHAQTHARGHAATAALRKVIEANEFDVPQGMVRAQAGHQLREQYSQFVRAGLQMQMPKLEDLPEEVRDGMMTEASFAVKQELVLEAIAAECELEVTDDDLDQRIAEMAAEIGQQPAAVKGLLIKNQGLEGLRARLLEEKATDVLLEKAEVIDVEPGWYHAHGDDHGHGHDHDHADADHDHDHDHADHDHDHADEAPEQADEADEAAEPEGSSEDAPSDSDETT